MITHCFEITFTCKLCGQKHQIELVGCEIVLDEKKLTLEVSSTQMIIKNVCVAMKAIGERKIYGGVMEEVQKWNFRK